MKQELNIIELFAGIGAPRMALEAIGCKVNSLPVEIDKHAVCSYNAIYDENHSTVDIKGFDAKYLNNIDIVMGGFPCTDLSMVGKTKGMSQDSNTRSSLVWEMIRVVDECKPSIIFIENVKALLSKRYEKDLTIVLDKIKSMGYDIKMATLISSDFGLPQKRERVYMVCTRYQTSFDFGNLIKTKPKPLSYFLDNDNVYDEPLLLSSAMKDYITSKDKTGKFSVSNKMIINPSIVPTITTREGTTRIASSTYICETLPRDYNIVDTNIQNHTIRRISSLEAWRLMGFSDEDYKKAKSVCSKTQLLKQAGNSITVPVLESIFKELLKDY